MQTLIVTIRAWWEKSSKQQRTLAVLFLIGILATGMLLMVSGEPGGQGDSIGSSLYYAGVMVKTLGVLLLIVGGAVLLRRFQVSSGKVFGRQLKLVETVRIAPRQALHLVQIGDRRLLIGATDQSISLLADLEGETESSALARPSGGQFGDLLQTVQQGAHEGEMGGRL